MSHSLKRFFLLLLAVALVAPAPAAAQRGALTVPRNLSQLTDRSAVIVRGHVISARVEKHPELTGLNTVLVTLRVKETLKGQTGDTFTFRQYLWDIRDLHDAAGYRKGQEYLLLMNAPNQKGLASPTGMEQGRFRIFRDREGKEVAANGHSNFALFRNLVAQLAKSGKTLSPRSAKLVQAHRSGPIPTQDLTALIRELLAGGDK